MDEVLARKRLSCRDGRGTGTADLRTATLCPESGLFHSRLMGNGRLTGGAYGLGDRLFRRAPAARVAGRLRLRSAPAPATRPRPFGRAACRDSVCTYRYLPAVPPPSTNKP